MIFGKSVSDFLIKYQPKDNHFTSKDEMKMICSFFCLDNMSTDEIRNLRNNIVEFYSKLMDNEIIYDDNGEYDGRTAQFWKYLYAMESVICAIDYFGIE